MRIYFATNDKYYSKVMRFLFKEPVSHVASGFWTDKIDIIVDSTKPHGKAYHKLHWDSKYKTKYFIDIAMSAEDELAAYQASVASSVMVPYDWQAYWYAFYKVTCRWLFGIPLPTHNKYEDPSKNLCQEAIAALRPYLIKYDLDMRFIDFSGLTPHMIGRALYKRTDPRNKNVSWPLGGPDANL